MEKPCVLHNSVFVSLQQSSKGALCLKNGEIRVLDWHLCRFAVFVLSHSCIFDEWMDGWRSLGCSSFSDAMEDVYGYAIGISGGTLSLSTYVSESAARVPRDESIPLSEYH